MSEGLRRGVVIVSAGAVIGIVEVVLAISFAVLVFSGFLEDARPAGIGIYPSGSPMRNACTPPCWTRKPGQASPISR